MNPEDLSNSVVARLVTAINDGNRAAFLAHLTPDATLTDDGTERTVGDWIDREIFTVNGHMTVDREEDHGLRLYARYRNDTWGAMSTVWRFQLSGDKISRIETGQACAAALLATGVTPAPRGNRCPAGAGDRRAPAPRTGAAAHAARHARR
jgi:hypothetical protein